MILETPQAFAERTGLPVKIVRSYVKQGILPYIQTGKSHVLIHVEAALSAVRQIAEITAQEKAETMPTILPRSGSSLKNKQSNKKHYKGRIPDAVRLGRIAK